MFSPKSSLPESITVMDNKLFFIAMVNRKRNIFVVSKSGATAITPLQKQITFSITPNPATSFLAVNLEGEKTEGEVKVYDISGKLVLTQLIQPHNNKVSTSTLPSGIYIVSFQSHSQKYMQKVRIN